MERRRGEPILGMTLVWSSGPGFMYQRFFGGDTDNYFTILFGGDLEAQLPYGSKFTLKAEYLPEIFDFKDSYLIRTFADWA